MSYGSGGAYAYAKLAIDVAKDNYKKDQEIKRAEKARSEENQAKGLLSLLGMYIGHQFGGTTGATLGKNLASGFYDFVDPRGEYIPEYTAKFDTNEWDNIIADLKSYDKSTGFLGDEWSAKFASDLWSSYLSSKTQGMYKGDTA